jgi:hypothetical protein
MNIAFLHYHTRKGGVTTVIGQQIGVMRDQHACLMIKGEEGGVDFGIPTRVVSGLGYDGTWTVERTPSEIAGAIEKVIEEQWPDRGCDVLHIHNPLLKKNSKFMRIIRSLQERGLRLFLQIHDFAEDGRPSVYFREDAYPTKSHYGVINKRDYNLLIRAGLRHEGLHYIPNMVTGLPYGDFEGEPDVVLYPVRAIRRKNVGEILLHSLFVPEHLHMGVTLPPNSPRDVDSFTQWEQLVRQLSLPVLLNLGIEEDFTRVLGRTYFVITTSIKEGFGFSYLEPWTIGKEVRGRWLEAVCPDFENNGISFDKLYDRFFIPLRNFDEPAFKERWMEGVARWAGQFEVVIPRSDREKAYGSRLSDGWIDFAQLDETAQTEAITTLAEDDRSRSAVYNQNPWLGDFFEKPCSHCLTEENRKIILDVYGPTRYRENLLSIYSKIEKSVPHQVEKDKVLDQFLHIDNYLPLGS